MAEASPTVARWALARLLRERRESSGILGSKAAAHAGMHAGTLSKAESALTRLQPGTALLLMRYYGASDEECEFAFQLAHLARRKGWWRSYKSVPEWFEAYLGLETDAARLHEYQAQWVPDLFQTEEYTLRLAQSRIPELSDDQVREQVALSRKRQERLTDPSPLRLDMVMDETALRRTVGDTETMKAQLKALLERCALPNVTCRVFPFSAGGLPHQSGSFAHLSFEEDSKVGIAYGDVVYQAHEGGAVYLEDADHLALCRAVFENLRNRSLSEDDSRVLIERVIAELG